jgi:hypothetical protein
MVFRSGAAGKNQQENKRGRYAFHKDPALFKESRKDLQKVRRKHSILTKGFCTEIAGFAVEPGSTGCGSQCRQLLSHKGGDDARQNISTAADSHTGVTGVVYITNISVGDNGFVAFEQQNAV